MGFPETDAEKLWSGVVAGVLAVLVGGSIVAPDLVYAEFIWQYFWGPVVADAHGAACAVWNGGTPQMLGGTAACATATQPVAYPGYTIVSEIGYALTLIVALIGVVFVLRRLGLGKRTRFIYPLIPFMLFGGALRVVEDALDETPEGVNAAIQFPWNTLLISPLIYFTVFFITLGALLVAVYLSRAGYTEGYEMPLLGAGTAFLLVTLGYLVWLAVTQTYVEFHPVFTVLTMVLAIGIAVGLWWPIRTHVPWLAAGTPYIGGVILWAHSVDGVSNVLGIDWGAELGLARDLVPKHPVNRFVIEFAQGIIPDSLASIIGTAWPFLLLKIVAATVVIALFDEQMVEESPRFSVLLLIAVIAVGLGPGTRDMLRATFGI